MSTVEQLTADIQALQATVAATDAKLDEVRAFIVNLQSTGGGGGATQAQIDELAALVGATKTAAEAVLAETDALDG